MAKALQSCGKTYGGFLAVSWAPNSSPGPACPVAMYPCGEGGPFAHCCAGLTLSGCSGVSFLIKYICFVKLPKNNPGLVHAGGWR